MQIRTLIEEKFSEPTPCNGHCQQQSKMKFLTGDKDLLFCFVCPAGYISRVIAYGEEVNVRTFKEYLSKLLSGTLSLEDEDIRVATRYIWDLGVKSSKDRVFRAAYWTQNYRRTKSDDPDRISLFLCSNCNSPFLQPFTSMATLCQNCR